MSQLSKCSTYSLIATGISFIALLIFYYVKKPDFVKELDDSGNKVFSVRLSIIYSLLFSSAIGLLVLGATALFLSGSSQDKPDSSVQSSIEMKSTVGSGKSSFGLGTRRKSLKCCGMPA